MFRNLKAYILPLIITISALSVSASAAFYSVSGLSKLFAGAAFEVMIMAGSLEFSKLVIATLLHKYWKTISTLLKVYLSSALVILVLITSMGIYGFLSSAYQETANKAGGVEAQISLIEVKRDNIKDQLLTYNAEKASINTSISELRAGLSGNKIQYKDRETGQIITTTSSSTRKSLERQLTKASERQESINIKVDLLNQQLFDYETEIVEVGADSELAGELGPLKYISGLTGIPMDEVINYLLLVIIFVFDPLAIALVIASNFAFSQIIKKPRKKTRTNLYGEQIPISEETKPVATPTKSDPLEVTDNRDFTYDKEENNLVVESLDEEPSEEEEHQLEVVPSIEDYMEFDDEDDLPNEALTEAFNIHQKLENEKFQRQQEELKIKKSEILRQAVKDIVGSATRSTPKNYAQTKIEETLKIIQELEDTNTKTY